MKSSKISERGEKIGHGASNPTPSTGNQTEKGNLDEHTRDRSNSITVNPQFMNRASLLSAEASYNSYRGFLNLGIILLFITNFRMVLENIFKYGFLLSLSYYQGFIGEYWRWPALSISLVLLVFIFMAFVIEKSASRRPINDVFSIRWNILNIASSIFVPSALVWTVKPNPASAMVVMILSVTLTMKLVSYAHVNYQLRFESKTKKVVGYPENLTVSNLCFFMACPTLVYQLEYPRSQKIRKLFLLRRIFEAIFVGGLIIAIVEQYIVPLVHHSVQTIRWEPSEIVYMMERILKLSVPNLYVWLLGFYWFFHIYLNILAEVLTFGDRLFYKDWWNSTTLSYYWRTWNIPVHTWMLTHVYSPARNTFGFSKTTSYLICFLISAAFHELVIAVPFQILKLWTFFGMMAQIPLVMISGNLRGNQLGNILFWASIVLGQPFLVLMMYRAWYEKNYGPIEIPVEPMTMMYL